MQCAFERIAKGERVARGAMMDGGRFTGRMSNDRALKYVHGAYTLSSKAEIGRAVEEKQPQSATNFALISSGPLTEMF